MSIFFNFLFYFVLLVSSNIYGEDLNKATNDIKVPIDKEKFHLFLLVGQSNMAGRGEIDKSKSIVHPRVWMLDKENQWVPAKDPVHFDKKTAGVGLSLTFAKILADKYPDINIGLIPCAVGGTGIDQWKVGQPLFKNALDRTTIAMQKGTLKGILWHQGENDAGKNTKFSQKYEDKLFKLVSDFREAFKFPSLPFVSGELGRWHLNEEALQINTILNSLKTKLLNYDCVSSEGLLNNPKDTPHFLTEAYLELGKRYAASFLKLMENKK
jgi:hypothetical protein